MKKVIGVLDMTNLLIKDNIIKTLEYRYDKYDIFSLGRKLGIDTNEYYVENGIHKETIERFVTRVYQKGQDVDLKDLIDNRSIQASKNINTSDRTAEKFGKIFNSILEGLNNIDEKYFAESELFTPTDFEEKMREKANLSEDIINIGIKIKPDISVLRRKAYNLDYKRYDKMLQKLARFYRSYICTIYPLDKYTSNERFNALYDQLLNMVPDELYDTDDDIDEKVEGIIFDTISQCLIFNE